MVLSVKGIKAIKEEKAQIKTNSGFLDEEKIKETIAYYKELSKKITEQREAGYQRSFIMNGSDILEYSY